MTFSITSPNVTSPGVAKRPRRSWTPAEQAAHLADFTASGLSATAFCRRLGIERATLARWRQRASTTGPARGRRATRPPAGAAGFAAVTVASEAAPVERPDPTPCATWTVPSTPSLPRSLTLVLRAPSGVAADVAGLDVATAAMLLRAVLTPAAGPPAATPA